MKKILDYPRSSTPGLIALAVIAVVMFLTLFFTGCQTKLDPAGVYQSDVFLYNADKTISVAKLGLQEFVKWERDNRATITNTWPQVTIAADKIRAEAPYMFALVGIARTSYIQVKTSLGSNTNAPSLASAKTAFQDSVDAVGQKVNDANTASAVTTLSNRPVIKLPAVNQ